MTREPLRWWTLSCALGVLSASIIAFELVLMQILSIVQWYHFAYMIISVALLGFGASGTILAFSSAWLVNRFDRVLPVLLIATGLAMPAALWCSQIEGIRFDSYLVFARTGHLWRLGLTYLILFVPFVLGALAIGLIFVKYSRHIGRLYGANLVGSGAGGMILVLLLWLFFPGRLVAVISLACIVSGLLTVRRWSAWAVAGAGIAVMLPALFFVYPPGLHLSEFKDLRRALDLPGAVSRLEQNSPFGLFEIVSSPALRYAPGISLRYDRRIVSTDAVFINGDWRGPVGGKETLEVLGFTTGAVAYELRRPESPLVLDAGTGQDVLFALGRGAPHVIAVEPNPLVVQVLETSMEALGYSPVPDGSVRLVTMNSRTYLDEGSDLHDLIVLPQVGSFGGTSGLFALKEQYLLTREAFSRVWDRLSGEGLMSITCWMDYPSRNPLRILATITSVLRDKGVFDPVDHVAAIRGWGTMTFVIKRSPITSGEGERIRDFCSRMLFDPVLLPDISPQERVRYNRLEDRHFFDLIDGIMAGQTARISASYDFAIAPATDNRPYFSQFLKIRSIPRLARIFGAGNIPFMEVGYVLVFLTLFQIVFLAVVLIVAPLTALGWRNPHRAGVLVYFGGIGIGYMFVEIVFIQRFILYFSTPIYSAAAILSVMLVCSGIGSYLSSRWHVLERSLPQVVAAIVCYVLVAAVALPAVIRSTIAVPGAVKVVLALLCIAPLSVIMGVPFPAGISAVRKKEERLVAWAWGINGCFSVMSTVLATIVAAELGFAGVMVCAAAAYGLALVASLRLLGGGGVHA